MSQAAFDDVTVRGRTGFVTMMKPVPNEKDSTVAKVLGEGMAPDCLRQIRYVFADDPSGNLWNEFHAIMPNLEAQCLDTSHLPIVYEYATWGKRTAGSK